MVDKRRLGCYTHFCCYGIPLAVNKKAVRSFYPKATKKKKVLDGSGSVC